MIIHNEARHLFQRAYRRGRLKRIWSKLTGRSRRLLPLNQIVTGEKLLSSFDGGLQIVPIAQILGSQNRPYDFDRDFYPLQAWSSGRWIGIAQASLQEVIMPPVHLIQIGDIYFVQDGHHRLSVAQALGQSHVDAEVKVWRIKQDYLGDKTMIDKSELERRYEAYLQELDREAAAQQDKSQPSSLQRRVLLQLGNRLISAGQYLKTNAQTNL